MKEIKLPDFLARSPGVVAEMLIPLGEVPGDRLLHLSGVRVVGVVDDGSRHSAQNSLNHIEKLRRCGKRHQFDDRANRQRSSFIVELIQRFKKETRIVPYDGIPSDLELSLCVVLVVQDFDHVHHGK